MPASNHESSQSRKIAFADPQLKDFKYVADNVPSSLRNDDLSFNHHAEVAKLTQEKQELFLNS